MDALVGRVLAELVAEAHLMEPAAVADLLAERARPLGVHGVRIYLADLQQRRLRPLPGGARPAPEALAIDTTLAGRAFQTVSAHHTPMPGTDGRFRLWEPLIDGTERIGVLEFVVDDVGAAMLARYRTLASVAGLIVSSKSAHSDTYDKVRRCQTVTMQAELVWGYMAPPTFATEQVVLSAVLEPAYEVGGDAYDYSLVGDRLHISLFDAVGHDLAAGLITSVAMAACRNTRRSGGDLADIVACADQAIADQFGASRFATALLCDLDLGTGRLTWIPCGHPPPLLIRDNKVVKELFRPPWLPLGLADHFPGAFSAVDGGDWPPPVYDQQLQPGDRLLLYTDGVTEARAADGSLFGPERLGDFIVRNSAFGIPAPETLRRLNNAIVDHQHGDLSDDATTILLEWMPGHP